MSLSCTRSLVISRSAKALTCVAISLFLLALSIRIRQPSHEAPNVAGKSLGFSERYVQEREQLRPRNQPWKQHNPNSPPHFEGKEQDGSNSNFQLKGRQALAFATGVGRNHSNIPYGVTGTPGIYRSRTSQSVTPTKLQDQTSETLTKNSSQITDAKYPLTTNSGLPHLNSSVWMSSSAGRMNSFQNSLSRYPRATGSSNYHLNSSYFSSGTVGHSTSSSSPASTAKYPIATGSSNHHLNGSHYSSGAIGRRTSSSLPISTTKYPLATGSSNYHLNSSHYSSGATGRSASSSHPISANSTLTAQASRISSSHLSSSSVPGRNRSSITRLPQANNGSDHNGFLALPVPVPIGPVPGGGGPVGPPPGPDIDPEDDDDDDEEKKRTKSTSLRLSTITSFPTLSSTLLSSAFTSASNASSPTSMTSMMSTANSSRAFTTTTFLTNSTLPTATAMPSNATTNSTNSTARGETIVDPYYAYAPAQAKVGAYEFSRLCSYGNNLSVSTIDGIVQRIFAASNSPGNASAQDWITGSTNSSATDDSGPEGDTVSQLSSIQSTPPSISSDVAAASSEPAALSTSSTPSATPAAAVINYLQCGAATQEQSRCPSQCPWKQVAAVDPGNGRPVIYDGVCQVPSASTLTGGISAVTNIPAAAKCGAKCAGQAMCPSGCDCMPTVGIPGSYVCTTSNNSNKMKMRRRKRDVSRFLYHRDTFEIVEEVGCACNTTYISAACCDSRTGVVYESWQAQLWLAE